MIVRTSSQFATISPGTPFNARSASRARSNGFGSLTCGTSRKIGAMTFQVGHWAVIRRSGAGIGYPLLFRAFTDALPSAFSVQKAVVRLGMR
jgi:hypothetical protein